MPAPTRHPPTKPYSGLTIILSEPSRHDTQYLISGQAGQYYDTCMSPITRQSCDIKTIKDNNNNSNNDFLPGTKIVLLFDQKSLTHCFPGKNYNLNEQRGNLITDEVRYPGINFICTYSPQEAFDRKNYAGEDESEYEDDSIGKSHGKTKRKNWRFWLYNDLQKTKRWLKGEYKYSDQNHQNHLFKIVIYPDIQQLSEILKQSRDKEIVVDIETRKDFHLTCIGLKIDSFVYVVPIHLYDGSLAYDINYIRKFIQSLAICFCINNNAIVGHNLAFDLFILCWKYKIPFPKKVFDTMLSWHRCYPEVEKSLGHLTSFFLDRPYHKNDGGYEPKSQQQDQSLWQYNAADIITTSLIREELKTLIAKLDVQTSVNQVNAGVRPYLIMQYQGMKIDTEAFVRRFDELEFQAEQYGRCLKIITKSNLNPRSPQQVAKYLYIDLGLPLPHKDPTNEKQLLRLLTKAEVPSVKLILAYRKCRKLASSLKFNLWGENFDRLTCFWSQTGTETFRLGSRALLKFSPFKGYGTNCQNWHKSMRRLVVAAPGRRLVQADQAGAEAVIVAFLCRRGRFRSLFECGVKPHVFVAMHLFQDQWRKKIKELNLDINLDKFLLAIIPELKTLPNWKQLDQLIRYSDNWPARERYYFIAKQVCHSSNYDIKALAFQLNVLLKSEGHIALSIAQCKIFLELYHKLFPEIREWHEFIRYKVSTERKLRNLFYFQRVFTAPKGDDLFKEAYAFIPQSTVGSITNIGIIELQEQIEQEGLDIDILQNGHDSILIECNDNDVEVADAANRLKTVFGRELVSPKGEKFKMGVEVSTGYNWGGWHETKNPRGLQEYKNA